MGRIAPDLGFRLRDHTWSLTAVAGGDLLAYPRRSSATIWNQRARLALVARATRRLTVESDLSGTYAFDPAGLARLGIFAPDRAAALVAGGKLRAAWRATPDWQVVPFFEERVVRFDSGSGAASHSPGLEVTRRVGHHVELGGMYRFNYFQGLGGARDARAHETQAVARYRLGRSLFLEGHAGVAFWTGPRGDSAVVPQAMVQLVPAWRGGGARFTARHGVGLGLTATPGLFDSLEAGVTTRLGRHFELHADGGIWRSGAIPWGAGGVLGYGVQGSFDYRVDRSVLIGVGASRFARLDSSEARYERNIVGLHVTWELRQRGEP
jgi:hypothetical protein